MNHELTVQINDTLQTVFVQKGFFSGGDPASHLHEHTYTEVHVVFGGVMHYLVGEEKIILSSGELFAIPAHTLHACAFCGEGARHAAFQVKVPIDAITRGSVSEQLLQCFFSEVSQSALTGNLTKMSAYISLLCCDLFAHYDDRGPNDYAFIIHEFFSHRYVEDVTLSDLAAELHLSEKQTHRLVEKYTGNTFKKELVRHRMVMARYLRRTTDMSLAQIADYVGYRSYSGFWKAYKKQSEE